VPRGVTVFSDPSTVLGPLNFKVRETKLRVKAFKNLWRGRLWPLHS